MAGQLTLPGWCRALLVAIVTLVAGPAWSQPPLPEGLGEEPRLPEGMDGGEPPLPAGMEGDGGVDRFREWPAAGDGEASSSPLRGVTGFWELRLGHRLVAADNQRQGSLAEGRLELEKAWQWQDTSATVTADLLYDAIEESHGNDLETGAGWLDLREAWVERRLSESADLKVGRQILTWGVGDLVFINDLFPKDWNSFLAGRDEQYLKAPSDALKLGFYSDAVNINLVYTPRFDADRFIDGRRLSYYSPLAGRVVGQDNLLAVQRPDDTGSDDEWAVRLYRRLGSYEVALYGYHGFWKSAGGFDPATGLAVFPALRVAGISARGPVGRGIASFEAGYYHSPEDSGGDNPFINNDEIRLLLGYEWEPLAETTIGVQYYLEALQDYSDYRRTQIQGVPQRDHYRQLLTLRLTRLAMNQNLTWGLFVFYSATDEDAYLRPRVHYKASDNWAVEAGMNLFAGQRDHTFFGQFEDNSNIYGAIRYSF